MKPIKIRGFRQISNANTLKASIELQVHDQFIITCLIFDNNGEISVALPKQKIGNNWDRLFYCVDPKLDAEIKKEAIFAFKSFKELA